MDEKRESLNIRFLGKDQFFGGRKLVLKFQFQLFLLFQGTLVHHVLNHIPSALPQTFFELSYVLVRILLTQRLCFELGSNAKIIDDIVIKLCHVRQGDTTFVLILLRLRIKFHLLAHHMGIDFCSGIGKFGVEFDHLDEGFRHDRREGRKFSVFQLGIGLFHAVITLDHLIQHGVHESVVILVVGCGGDHAGPGQGGILVRGVAFVKHFHGINEIIHFVRICCLVDVLGDFGRTNRRVHLALEDDPDT